MYLSKGAWLIGGCLALFSASAPIAAQIPSAMEGVPKIIPLVNVGKSVSADSKSKGGLFRQNRTNITAGKKVTLAPVQFALLSSSADSSITGASQTQASPMQSGPPSSTVRADMPPVTAEDSQRTRALRVFPNNLNEGALVGLAGDSGHLRASGITGDMTARGPASIKELARSLRNNPDLIYQYVRNNVEYYPIFGVQKGALGAVLDNQGTAHDQATLMVELLRASGVEAAYIRGAINLDANQAASWYGVDTSNACAVANVLGQGQIPIYEITATNDGKCPEAPSPLVSVAVEHIWVKAKIDGAWYVFDPSLKSHSFKTGINLADPSTTGYNATTYLGLAITTSTNTADWVQNISRSNIRNNLTTYASNLATYLRRNKPGATLDDVIGGQSIDQFYDVLRETTLPYEDARWQPVEYVDLPNEFKITLRIQYQGIDQTYTSDAIYGRRLSITYNVANQPVLKLDGNAVGVPGTAAPAGATTTINFTVAHNAYASPISDQSVSQTLVAGNGNTYVIANSWGATGRGPAENYRSVISNQRSVGAGDTSEPLLGSTLAMVGAQWTAQADQAGLVAGQLANSIAFVHHRVGIVGYANNVYVDLPANTLNIVSKAGDRAMDRAAVLSWSMHHSILESTAVQQTTGVPAVSTTQLIDLAAIAGQRIYNATASRFATYVQPNLVSCASEIPAFNAAMAAGRRVITPARCDIAENKWSGAGYFVVGPGAVGAMISGGFAGGFSTANQSASAANSKVNTSQTPPSSLTGTPFNYYNDPIDMVKGSFSYDHVDIDAGAGPYPQTLSFKRLYSSGNRYTNGPLGKGWTHNFDATAITGSDGFQAMGESSALSAVGTIMEQKASLDLLKDPALPIGTFVTVILGQKWFGDQLIDNTAIVTQGLDGEVFVKLPDGTYNAPPGKSSKLTKNADGTFTYEFLNRGVLKFNAAGKADSYTDPSNIQVKYTYSSAGDLIQVQNSLGRTLTIANANSRISSVANGPLVAGSGVVNYAYDTSGNLTTFTDAVGKNTTFAYSLPGRIGSIYYPSFPTVAAVTNVYDTLDRVSRQTNARGKSYDYYFAGFRTEEIAPGGGANTNYVDGQGNVVRSSTPLANLTINTYDGQSRLIRSELPEGNAVEYTYDDTTCASAEKRCTHNVKTISKLGPTGAGVAALKQSFTYESAFNRVATATDPNGNVTAYTYTAQGMPLTVTSPVDSGGVAPVTTYEYTSFFPAAYPTFYLKSAETVKIASNSQVTTTTSYDATNKFAPKVSTVDSVLFGARLAKTFTLDAVGNVTVVSGPGKNLSTFSYDADRRVIQASDASQVPTVTSFDADGRSISTSTRMDQQGAQWMTSCTRYSATGKATRVWGPALTATADTCPAEAAPVAITDTSYDDLDRISLVTQNLTPSQGGNRVTQTVYNADDTVQALKRAVGTPLEQSYATYQYTPNGNLHAVLDAKNNATVYTYDVFDRRVRAYYPLPATPGYGNANDYEENTYDANGNVTSMRKRNGKTIAQAWDKLNRLVARTYPDPADNVQFTYDLRGLRTKAMYSSGSHTNTYGWDGAARLSETGTDGRVMRYTYDASNNRINTTWPGGFFITTEYDSNNRPVNIREYGGVYLATYTYDNLGRRTNINWNNGAATSFQYGPQGLLSSLMHKFVGGGGNLFDTYTRNQVGDMASVIVGNDDYAWRDATSRSRVYVRNGLNQYKSGLGSTFVYDANGNVTMDGVLLYTYDLDNRLKSANDTRFDYDPEGRLRSSIAFGQVTTELLYDGDKLVAEYDLNGNLVKRYVHGPGTDEPIVSYDGPGVTSKMWMLADYKGSIVATMDANGARMGAFSYGPLGETSGLGRPRFMFTGQQYFGELELYYYKARFYNPRIGRFLQTDPAGTKDDLNLYTYVGNNPVNRVDPTGLAKVAVGDAIQVAGVKNGDTMGGDGRENEQAKSVAVKLGLDKDQRRQLHDVISGEGLTYLQVLDEAKRMFNK
jgi:RHS repeat-associated protein